MLISFVATGPLSYAAGLRWPGMAPGIGLPYYSWTSGQWQSEFDATCLYPIGSSQTSPTVGVMEARVPDVPSAAEVVMDIYALDRDNNPVYTVDQQVLEAWVPPGVGPPPTPTPSPTPVTPVSTN